MLLLRQLKTARNCAYFQSRAWRSCWISGAISKSFSSSTHNPVKERPFRLAVIGSGPAGFYAAYRVMSKVKDAAVDMYERLPVPYGLVRFGVAPDHPEVKNCQDKFEQVAESPRFNFVGNIAVGKDVPLKSLIPHYDAVLFAYGASKDKRLGVPGEDLEGVYSARSFVGWYNGLPGYADLKPKLDAGEEAVIIGMGNVALDVARILLSSVDRLRKTDISSYALETLSQSRVERVTVVGRRGLMQASFTIKEIRELMHLPDVHFAPVDLAQYSDVASTLPRQKKRILQVISKGSDAPASGEGKIWALRFLLSPVAFEPVETGSKQLGLARFEETEFIDENFIDSSTQVKGTGRFTTLPASICFRSIGYKSTPLHGLQDLGIPFDDRMGIIPNDIYGRVINPETGPGTLTAGHVPGFYCAGWVKRGPTGVIASTMDDAFTTGDIIVRDLEQNVPLLNAGRGGSTGLGWKGIEQEALKKGLRPVSWQDWKKIDAVEKERGRALGKEREKFSRVEDMLQVLDS